MLFSSIHGNFSFFFVDPHESLISVATFPLRSWNFVEVETVGRCYPRPLIDNVLSFKILMDSYMWSFPLKWPIRFHSSSKVKEGMLCP